MQVTHPAVTGTDNPAFPVSKTVYEAPHDIVGAPLSIDVDVTTAELLALASTHKELVPAPGANKIIVPTSITAHFKYGSNHFSSDDSDPTVGYGNGFNIFSGSIYVVNQFDDSITFFDLSVFASGQTAAELINKALNLEAVGTLSGGTGSTLRVHVEYVIFDLA